MPRTSDEFYHAGQVTVILDGECFMVLGLLLILTIILLYTLAALRLWKWLRRRWRGGPPLHPVLKLFDQALIASAILGIVVVMYGFWVEPQWVQVSNITIATEKLPPGSTPIRIVQVSDLHSPSNLPLQARVPKLVAAQEPDVIVFSGDAANSPEGLGAFHETLARLTGIAPTYAVRGNYDLGDLGDADLFTRAGAEELIGTTATAGRGAATITISGAPFWADWPQVYATLQSLPADMFVVFVGHTPDRVYDVAPWGVDLYLAGHTHGGQVALPWYGALWTNSAYGRRFERGLVRVDDTWLYVNRGIGMTAYLPRVRFLSRPEITVIEITPAQTAVGQSW